MPDQIPEECHDKFEKIITKLEKFEKRLYIDNGENSLQTRINNNTHAIKLVIGLLVVVGSLFLTITGFAFKIAMFPFKG